MKKLILKLFIKLIFRLKLDSNFTDGYHTFEELYEFRKMYNAALFNEWAKNWYMAKYVHKKSVDERFVLYDVHKSWRHNDGEKCFGTDDYFIVVAKLPLGQISNHYHKDDWDLFKIPEAPKAKYKFDGHTSKDVLERLKML